MDRGRSAALDLPKLGVHGNHDTEHLLREVEVDDLHMRRTSLGRADVRGLRGLRPVRPRRHHYHYTQRKASRLARRLPAADVLLSHCPPRGIDAIRTTPRTSASTGCATGSTSYHPRHILHGHVHPIAGLAATSYGDSACTGSRARAMLQLD